MAANLYNYYQISTTLDPYDKLYRDQLTWSAHADKRSCVETQSGAFNNDNVWGLYSSSSFVYAQSHDVCASKDNSLTHTMCPFAIEIIYFYKRISVACTADSHSLHEICERLLHKSSRQSIRHNRFYQQVHCIRLVLYRKSGYY